MSEQYIVILERMLDRSRDVMKRALEQHRESQVCGDSPKCSPKYPSSQRCWVCQMNLMIEEIDNL